MAEAVDAFSGWHHAVTGMLGCVEEDPAWWALHDYEPLDRWAAGRVVLIGDAAHAMLPHQGQRVMPDGPKAQRRDAHLPALPHALAWIHDYDVRDAVSVC